MFIHFRRAGLWSNAPFWLLALFISLCIARGVATYNVGLRSCCWQPRYWQNHMDLISYSSRQTPEKQVRAIRVFVRRRGNVAFAWQKVRKKREEARWVWVCVCVFRSQSHPIYFLFVCVCVWGGIVLETAPFLDAIITQARPRSQAWDVATHQGIVDQYWLICATSGNISAHLCLSRRSVYVINMEDK